MPLSCPRCIATPTLPAEPEAGASPCPICQTRQLEAGPIALDDNSFAGYLTRCELPVLVDAGAQWCGPCRGMAPHFADAARALAGTMVLATLDIDACTQTAARLRIQTVPTLILFERGRELARASGARGADEIRRWALAHLADTRLS